MFIILLLEEMADVFTTNQLNVLDACKKFETTFENIGKAADFAQSAIKTHLDLGGKPISWSPYAKDVHLVFEELPLDVANAKTALETAIAEARNAFGNKFNALNALNALND